MAGRCLLTDDELAAAGFAAVYALTAEASYADESFVAPGPLLERIGARIAERHLGDRS